MLGTVFVNIYTDLLFFRSVHFSSVFTKVLGTRLVLFVIFGLIMGIAVASTLVIAYRLRPSIRPMSLEQQNLERYRLVLEPFHTWLLILIAGLAGILAGVSGSGRWRTYLLWVNGQKFGVKDPQFHRDISYFMFTYPFQRWLLGFAFTVVIVCLVIAALTHYFFGGIRLQTQDRVEKVIPAAKVHLSVMLGLFVLLKAVAYYLDRFGLAFSPRGKVTGASYTDVHAVLPAKTILLFISLLCAVLFIYNIRQRGWILPALSFGILVISALVIGGLYPTLIQYFSVRPNESVKEKPYIARNITATRAAYDIGSNKVSISTYPASQNVTAAQVGADKGTIPNTRLLDPVVLSKTFEQLQQIRSYYGFPPNLDIDRYTVNGKTQDYIVSVRELDQSGLSSNQRNWINLHLNYTHGKGFVAAPANTVDDTGRPIFAEENLPVTGPLGLTQDDIYFGEQSPNYSIVDTKQAEIDGPSGTNSANGDDQKTNHYSGTGGVSVGSTFDRLVFALKFGDKNLLLSSAITNKSRILYVRNPRTRVQKVAPWLTLDGDPYPAVINGRIVWILDGYTTSNGYPYSERTRLGDVTTDANTGGNRAAQANNTINYIRNSVKATVDAYTGDVTLYAFDPSDPLLKTWMKAFPGHGEDQDPAGAAGALPLPRRPFQGAARPDRPVPRTDPVGFYTQEDFWSVPDEPGNAGTQQPPFYQYAQLPGQSEPDFNLTSPMNAQRAPKLAAFMYVSSDPQNYGQIKVLELPQGVTINGPVQAKSTIESNADGVVCPEPAETVGQPDDQRQPAHFAGSQRADLCAAVLRPSDQRPGLSDAAGHRGGVRRSGRLRPHPARRFDESVRPGRRQYDHTWQRGRTDAFAEHREWHTGYGRCFCGGAATRRAGCQPVPEGPGRLRLRRLHRLRPVRDPAAGHPEPARDSRQGQGDPLANPVGQGLGEPVSQPVSLRLAPRFGHAQPDPLAFDAARHAWVP